MTQQELQAIIATGKTVPITSSLMLAVTENAHRQRSKAFSAGMKRLRCYLSFGNP